MTSERHFFVFCNFRKWIHIFLGQVKWGWGDLFPSTSNILSRHLSEYCEHSRARGAWALSWSDISSSSVVGRFRRSMHMSEFSGNCMFSRQLYVHCFLCVALLPTIHRNGPLQYDRIVSGMMGQSILFTASVSRRHNANWLGKQRDMSLLGIEPAPLPGQARPLTRLDSSPSARLHVCGCQLLPSHSYWTHIGTSQQSTCRIDSSGNSYAPVGM